MGDHLLISADPASGAAGGTGPESQVQSRSNTAAIPWPPPMHIVTSA